MGRNSRNAYHQYKQVRDLLIENQTWDCERGITPQVMLELIYTERRDIYEQIFWGKSGYKSIPVQSVAMLLHVHSDAQPKSDDLARYPFAKLSGARERPRRFSLRPELLEARRAVHAAAADEKRIAVAKRLERHAQRKAAIDAWEGAEVQRLNTERERGAVAQAFKKQLSHYRCEACDFDFEAIYGREARGFIEAHHKFPLSNGERLTTTTDFNAVCSNCHRMLHHKPNPLKTVEQLRRVMARCAKTRSE